MKNNIFKKIHDIYLMPQDCKSELATNNARLLIKLHPFLIAFGLGMLILSLVNFDKYFMLAYLRVFYYTGIIFTGIIGVLLSLFVIKHPFLKPSFKMIPIHFSVVSLLFFAMITFYSDFSLFNSFIIYACIITITPIFFKIEPNLYLISLIICSSIITKKNYSIYGLYTVINVWLFSGISSLTSFSNWRITKKVFIHQTELEQYKQNMEKEIQLASLVQESFFRHEEMIYDDWSIVFFSKPMAGVSGDFFDIYNTESKLEGLGIFDVSGHGISSGLVTMLVKNIIYQEFFNGKNDRLKTVIDRINVHYLKEKGNIENYLTGILCRIEEDRVDFVNAGHAMPIFYSAENNIADFVKNESEQSSFGAIGLLDMPNNFISHSIKMSKGDELILFTDGVTDAENKNSESFGKERLIKSIARNAERPLSTQINCILSDISNFAFDVPQKDDITMIILKKK